MKRKGTTRFWQRMLILAVASLTLVMFGIKVVAQDDSGDEAPATEEVVEAGPDFQVQIDTTWVLLTGMLVFFMQAGFAMLEAGLIRQSGVVNALLENFMDAGLTGLLFWAVGFGLAFGIDNGSGLFGTSNFFLGDAITFSDGAAIFNGDGLSILTLFFFQFAFAATASTIATGAMAERTDFVGDIIYSGIIALVIYPIVVHWVWGGGWLAQRGFLDFAGSTVVHSVGGVIALVGAIMLGPRKGRVFGSPPRPHNMALATIGTMILWFGWYGFNPGSTLGMSDAGLTGLVTVNTTLAAAAGTMATMFFIFFRSGKWDLSATLNGSLAGLVGITAGCAFVAPWASVVIGLVCGFVVILAADLLESLKIDDPVGAFAVHGACGIVGTLMIGLVGQPELGGNGLLLGAGADQLITQIIGVVGVAVWVSVTGAVMFLALKAVNRLRVNPKADEIGIDVYEHGTTVWPDVLPADGGSVSGSESRSSAPAVGD
ncbi:MAG: ammonium transporter [Anaerolineae bacterium]|nr:ammonium transporter [Anaerolineae bacterium]